ncbi:hypothetical protein B0H16DRAFT_1532342 [Mycena metata]|uniref:Uncharacterized protein n=1 Tax=Mycena metata TaxID=1033252 RepID=A0AAD7NFU3_9AGAR|nr:hypothetical protein B0H16DRAFT_1532342 [Mycena metata]
MLSRSETMTPRPRPPAQMRRSSNSRQNLQLAAQGASPPPPYASSVTFPMPELSEAVRSRKPSYLGSPMPATLQMVGRSQPSTPDAGAAQDTDWLNEQSREELAELLVKADDLIKERETELGVTSAVCKSLLESNVTLKNKHDALVARLPSTPRHSPPLSHASLSVLEYGGHGQDASFDSNHSNSSRVYLKRHARRISISPNDISVLADQNAELMQKLETLESEALTADRSGRRALKQLERELQLLREELEKTQARSEALEKTAQAGTEKIVEEMWRKKKEREAKFRAMRKNGTASGRSDDGATRDFAPAGFFSKSVVSPSSSVEFPQDDEDEEGEDSYGAERSFEHPQQVLVAQLLKKIQELEDTNTRILHQQSETADRLHAVQRETESISKVYECFSAENGVEWEVVGEDGTKSPMEGTIRFKSFRRSLETQDEGGVDIMSSLALPRKTRKSVLNLFGAAQHQQNEPVPSSLSLPCGTTFSDLGLGLGSQAPSEYDSDASSPRQTLEAELGSDFVEGAGADPFLDHRRSLYDISFSAPDSPSPSPTALHSRSLVGRVSDARAAAARSGSLSNALQLSVEPASPSAHEHEQDDGTSTEMEMGSVNGRGKARYRRMSQTLFLRTSRWVDGRFASTSSSSSSHLAAAAASSTSEGESGGVGGLPSLLPRRLSSALDVVMESFAGAGVGASHHASANPEDALHSPSATSVMSEAEDNTVVLDDGANQTQEREQEQSKMVRFVLEVWMWLQFAIIIVVFLWAMARRGPKSVLGEGDKRAVVKRRR